MEEGFLTHKHVESLPCLAFNDKTNLPKISCVYFVLAELDLMYVGNTQNLRKRFINHHRAIDFEGTTIYWLELIDHMWVRRRVEQYYITALKPLQNGKKVDKHNEIIISGIAKLYLSRLANGDCESNYLSNLIIDIYKLFDKNNRLQSTKLESIKPKPIQFKYEYDVNRLEDIDLEDLKPEFDYDLALSFSEIKQ